MSLVTSRRRAFIHGLLGVQGGPGTFSALKQAQDRAGMILRNRRVSSRPVEATVISDAIPLTAAHLCDAIEGNIHTLSPVQATAGASRWPRILLPRRGSQIAEVNRE